VGPGLHEATDDLVQVGSLLELLRRQEEGRQPLDAAQLGEGLALLARIRDLPRLEAGEQASKVADQGAMAGERGVLGAHDDQLQRRRVGELAARVTRAGVAAVAELPWPAAVAVGGALGHPRAGLAAEGLG